jgi:hypothetical protein
MKVEAEHVPALRSESPPHSIVALEYVRTDRVPEAYCTGFAAALGRTILSNFESRMQTQSQRWMPAYPWNLHLQTLGVAHHQTLSATLRSSVEAAPD